MSAKQQNVASTHVDIAIVGGGFVGTTLAIMLARAYPQWAVALIEAKPQATTQDFSAASPLDARATVISAGSMEILAALGLWKKLATTATAIGQIHVSDRGYSAGSLIDAAQHQQSALGYVVENQALGDILGEQLSALPNIQALRDTRVDKLLAVGGGSTLTLSPAKHEPWLLHARLTVIAEGGDSSLRNALGIAVTRQDYQQTALIATVAFSHPHQGVAYERFTEQGPLAVLPLGGAGGKHGALVWTLPNQALEQMLAHSDDELLSQLQEHFGYRLGKFTAIGQRHHYPLALVEAEEQIRSGIVLVGNAAHYLHPVAGQGFNLAVRDLTALVAALFQAENHKQNIGSLHTLQDYMQRQRMDQLLTIGLSDRLIKYFSNRSLPLVTLRHLGFLSLALFPPLREHFVLQTMGLLSPAQPWLAEQTGVSGENVE